MYIIQDKVTGNYLFKGSFQRDDHSKWMYITCTGRCNCMRYYPNKELADGDLHMLNKYGKEAKTCKDLHTIQNNISNIPMGKIVIEYV